MCMPKPPKPTQVAERQAVQMPDKGATGTAEDDIARRRRALMAAPFAAALSGSLPSVTKLGS